MLYSSVMRLIPLIETSVYYYNMSCIQHYCTQLVFGMRIFTTCLGTVPIYVRLYVTILEATHVGESLI